MAISRETKEKQVQQLSDSFKTSRLTVLVDYKGLTVAELQELRRELKANDSALSVIKNTLIRIAGAQHAPFKGIDAATFDGPTGLAFGFGDEISVAQILNRFAKTHPALEIKSAISLEGELLTADQVNQLASLPSRQQLLGQLVGTMAAPVSGLARVLKGNINNLVYVINAINQAKAA